MAYGIWDQVLTVSAPQIVSAFRWSAAGRICAQISSWVVTIFVMRLLTPTDYGLMGMAAIAMSFCSVVNDLGAIPALIQRREVGGELVRKIFGFVLVTNIVLFVLLYFAAPSFAAFFQDHRLVSLVRVLGIGFIVQALGSVPGALLRRDLKFKSLSLIDFVASLLGSGAMLLLALQGFGVWSLIAGGLTKTACNTVGAIATLRFRTVPSFDFSGLKPILSFGMKVSASSLVWYLNTNVDSVLIGRVLGGNPLGLYSVANNLALLPASKVMQLTNQVAFSAYSRIQDDLDRVRKYYLESARVASLFFFPVCWGMSAVSTDLIDLVLGATWHASAPVLQILTIAVPIKVFVTMADALVNGLGAPGISLRNSLTTTAIIPFALVAGIHWGLIGLCVAAVLGGMIAAMINLCRDLKVLQADYWQLVSSCGPAVLAAIAMYFAVVAVRAMETGLALPVRLSMEVGGGAIVYIALTLLINRHAVVQSLQLVRGI